MFRDRIEAGELLARRLLQLRDQDVVVLGLPRGGVPVAAEVARALAAPLDVIVVRKLGVPDQPELAMGAIGEHDTRVLDERVVRMAGVSPDQLHGVEARERVELERRVRRYRAGRRPEPLAGRTAVIIDDGVATGSTAQAACQVARALGAARVVLAVPVAPTDWGDHLAPHADELVSLETPETFMAVGEWYHDFSQVSDDDVVRLLGTTHSEATHSEATPHFDHFERVRAFDRSVDVPTDVGTLPGHLVVPATGRAVIVFAHGSGSSRHSSRNRWVAAQLNGRGLGTLLFDLLTPDEALDRRRVFDVELLGRRLDDAVRFIEGLPAVSELPIGLFGASTGAAAAIWEASQPTANISAVVSRGGRPDLAMDHLAAVHAPTLLIVGGNDQPVLDLNRAAATHLRCEHRISVVSGASHLFEQEGALEQVARLAADWFLAHC
jgi:putative phosphoribosyl transferase